MGSCSCIAYFTSNSVLVHTSRLSTSTGTYHHKIYSVAIISILVVIISCIAAYCTHGTIVCPAQYYSSYALHSTTVPCILVDAQHHTVSIVLYYALHSTTVPCQLVDAQHRTVLIHQTCKYYSTMQHLSTISIIPQTCTHPLRQTRQTQ